MLVLPDGYNGVTEVGIAAGTDVLSEQNHILNVLHRDVPTMSPEQIDALLLSAGIAGATFDSDKEKGKPSVANRQAFAHVVALAKLGSVDQIDGSVTAASLAAAIAKSNTEQQLWLEGTLFCMNAWPQDPAAAKLLCSGVMFLITAGWMSRGNANTVFLSSEQSRVVYLAALNALPQGSKKTLQNPFAFDFMTAQIVATIIAAVKITWWKINHHVGMVPNAIQGYAGKVIATIDELARADRTEIRSVIWQLGKHCSTIHLLSQLGVPDLLPQFDDQGAPIGNDAPLRAFEVRVAEDARVRIASNPAGTAKVCTYLAVAKYVSKSVYAFVCPYIDGYYEACGVEDDIRRHPAYYHMGSHFLTGRAQVVADPFTSDDKANLTGILLAMAPNSLLAKSNVLLPADEVRGNTSFMMAQSIKLQVVDLAGDLATKRLIARSGQIRGGLALQLKRITEDDIAQAMKETEDEKSGQAIVAAKK